MDKYKTYPQITAKLMILKQTIYNPLLLYWVVRYLPLFGTKNHGHQSLRAEHGTKDHPVSLMMPVHRPGQIASLLEQGFDSNEPQSNTFPTSLLSYSLFFPCWHIQPGHARCLRFACWLSLSLSYYGERQTGPAKPTVSLWCRKQPGWDQHSGLSNLSPGFLFLNSPVLGLGSGPVMTHTSSLYWLSVAATSVFSTSLCFPWRSPVNHLLKQSSPSHVQQWSQML